MKNSFLKWAPWVTAAAPILVWIRSWRGWTDLDHCPYIGCDFVVFYRQALSLFQQPAVIETDWVYPPMAAVLFSLFRPFSPVAALVVWSLINAALAVVLAVFCARELSGSGRWMKWTVAAGLVALSLPVMHSIKWGQISLLIVIGSIVALRQRTRLAEILFGFVIALKLYPVIYLIGPLVRRQWKKTITVLVAAFVCGLVVPLVVLKAEATGEFFNKALEASASLGGSEWKDGHHSAWYGGQGTHPLLARFFSDGGHVGLEEDATPLLFHLPVTVVTGLSILLALGIVIWSIIRLRDTSLDESHFTALTLTAVTLVIQPAWHHYFAFLPFGQAVVLGRPFFTRKARILAALSGGIAALPLVLLADVPKIYFHYSRWGGTGLAALLLWTALVLPSRTLPGPHPGKKGRRSGP